MSEPKWFRDTIPLDTLIAPMVLFLQNNGITTTESCEGGDYEVHLYGRPTVRFEASNMQHIERVAALLKQNELDIGSMVGLNSGFFSQKDGQFGLVQWIWKDSYKEEIYPRILKLVDMKEVESITYDHEEWVKSGYPSIR